MIRKKMKRKEKTWITICIFFYLIGGEKIKIKLISKNKISIFSFLLPSFQLKFQTSLSSHFSFHPTKHNINIWQVIKIPMWTKAWTTKKGKSSNFKEHLPIFYVPPIQSSYFRQRFNFLHPFTLPTSLSFHLLSEMN